MSRLTYEQRQNFRRATRLNAHNIDHAFREGYGFNYLRNLYKSCAAGQSYGLYSGYQP
jgi:hypothetical protein